MTYFLSGPPDITQDLPFTLSARRQTAVAVRSGFLWDYMVNGVGFMRYQEGEAAYRRVSTPVQKQQFDTSDEPGEQSLEGYWIRSQASCHRGAGILYYEPGSEEDTQHRFDDSQGVDVWTPGKVTLLKATDKPFTSPTATVYAASAVSGTTDLLILNVNGQIKRYDGTTTTDYVMGGVGADTRVALGGDKILWGHATGIHYAPLSGTAITALWTQAAGEAPVPYWAKSRIIATKGPDLYELTLAGGAMPAALYTHPSPSWVWTSVTDGPQAIYAAGNTAGTGAIFRFSLEDATAGATPKLGQAYQVFELPPGEQVHAIHGYLGRYLGIGTSRGLRVGVISEAGAVEVGPLLFETVKPVKCLTASKSFLVAGVEARLPDGTSGAIKVNLAERIGDTLQFAYATDAAVAGTGVVNSVAYLGNSERLAFAVASSGVFLQSATQLVSSGWIRSGRTRYKTVEPKWFRLVDVGAVLPAGSIAVSAISEGQAETLLATMTSATGPMRDIGIPSIRPLEYAQLKAILRPDENGLAGPELNSVQVRAQPAPRRIRRVQIPLAVCDRDRDRSGGYANTAGWGRLMALEEIEDSGAIITVVDNLTGDSFIAMAEQIDYTHTVATAGNAGGLGQGGTAGTATLVLRKL